MPSLSNHQSNEFVLTAEDVVAHFNRSVMVNEHGCWIWLGATDRRGYARLGGVTLVHGVTFRMAGFECGPDQEICHTCPNRGCINPYHLYAGTHKQNMEDAARAGLMGVKGKITEEQLQIVRQMLSEGIPKKDIAQHIGVSKSWISDFLAGRYLYAKP